VIFHPWFSIHVNVIGSGVYFVHFKVFVRSLSGRQGVTVVSWWQMLNEVVHFWTGEGEGGDDAEYVPQKPESVKHVEEGSFYSVRCCCYWSWMTPLLWMLINQSVKMWIYIAPLKQKFTEVPVTSWHAEKSHDLRQDLKPCLPISLFFSSDGRSFRTVGEDEQKLSWPKRTVHERGTTLSPWSTYIIYTSV